MAEPLHTNPEPLSKTRLRVWLKLLKTSNHVEATLRQRFRDQSTTLPRFDVMAALSRFPEGLKMSDLSAFLRVSAGNVTGIVDKLQDEGLAERVSVPGDRRAQVARLTDAGRATFAGLAEEHETWVDDLLGQLDPRDLRQLNDVLDRVLTEEAPPSDK